MLRHCSRLHENQVRAGDDTFKIVLNGYPLIINGVLDQQQSFHPTGIIFCSHYEQSVHFWGVTVIKAEACCHFNYMHNLRPIPTACIKGVLAGHFSNYAPIRP